MTNSLSLPLQLKPSGEVTTVRLGLKVLSTCLQVFNFFFHISRQSVLAFKTQVENHLKCRQRKVRHSYLTTVILTLLDSEYYGIAVDYILDTVYATNSGGTIDIIDFDGKRSRVLLTASRYLRGIAVDSENK